MQTIRMRLGGSFVVEGKWTGFISCPTDEKSRRNTQMSGCLNCARILGLAGNCVYLDSWRCSVSLASRLQRFLVKYRRRTKMKKPLHQHLRRHHEPVLVAFGSRKNMFCCQLVGGWFWDDQVQTRRLSKLKTPAHCVYEVNARQRSQLSRSILKTCKEYLSPFFRSEFPRLIFVGPRFLDRVKTLFIYFVNERILESSSMFVATTGNWLL